MKIQRPKHGPEYKIQKDLVEYLKKNYKPGESPKVKPDLEVDM